MASRSASQIPSLVCCPRTAAGLRLSRGPIGDACPAGPLFLQMRALAHGQIPIQFGDVLKNGDARKSFNDVEHFPNLRLQMDKRRLAAALFELFASRGKNTQTGAADELQVRQVKHEVFDTALPRQ